MIRNVVLGKLRAAPDPAAAERDRAALDEGLAGIASLELPGLIAAHVGPDAGLRDGNWDFAISNDWADEDAYREYDLDPEHNRHRALVVAVCSDVVRVQFRI